MVAVTVAKPLLKRRHEAVLQALEANEALGKHLNKTLKTALDISRELQPLVNVLRARCATANCWPMPSSRWSKAQ